MPGMDGLQATAAIRASERGTTNHLPIIALTAHAMREDRQRCLDAGMDGYLTTPFNANQLFETFESLMPRQGSVWPAEADARAGSALVALHAPEQPESMNTAVPETFDTPREE